MSDEEPTVSGNEPLVPYRDDGGRAVFWRSHVAYLDELGAGRRMQSFDVSDDQPYKEFREPDDEIAEARQLDLSISLRRMSDLRQLLWEVTEAANPGAFRSLSDDIFIAGPILGSRGGGMDPLGLVSVVGEILIRAIENGITYRGALHTGLAYVDETSIYGSALAQAVKLEKDARYPRVILSPQFTDELRARLRIRVANYEQLTENASWHVLSDEDGTHFVNHLAVPRLDRDRAETLEWHQRFVTDMRNEANREDAQDQADSIYEKAGWLAALHNYVVTHCNEADSLRCKHPSAHQFTPMSL